MNYPSYCPCCGEIIMIGICEACGYVPPLQNDAGVNAERTRALLGAVERQAFAENRTAWIVAVNATARAYAACGRWSAEAPGET